LLRYKRKEKFSIEEIKGFIRDLREKDFYEFDLHSHHTSFCTPSLAGIRLLPVAKAVVANGCKKGFVTLVSCHIRIT